MYHQKKQQTLIILNYFSKLAKLDSNSQNQTQLENFKISKNESPKVLTSKNEIQVFIVNEKKNK